MEIENQQDSLKEILNRQEILGEIRKIRHELEMINSHELVKSSRSFKKLFLLSFGRGVVTGFGTVVGATLVVSLFAFLISRIEFIPIIGEWIKEIITEVQSSANSP